VACGVRRCGLGWVGLLRAAPTDRWVVVWRCGGRSDEELSARVSARNEEYDAMVDRHRERDKYISRAAQTFNQTTRHKKIKVWPPKTEDKRLQASSWDIFDAYEANLNAAQNAEVQPTPPRAADARRCSPVGWLVGGCEQKKDDESDAMSKAGRAAQGLGVFGAAGDESGAAGGGGGGSGSGTAGPVPLASPNAASAASSASVSVSASQSVSRMSRSDDPGSSSGSSGSSSSSTAGAGAGAGAATPTRLFMNRLAGPSPFEVLSKSKSFLNSLQILGTPTPVTSVAERCVVCG
jgi:hypothetical protein